MANGISLAEKVKTLANGDPEFSGASFDDKTGTLKLPEGKNAEFLQSLEVSELGMVRGIVTSGGVDFSDAREKLAAMQLQSWKVVGTLTADDCKMLNDSHVQRIDLSEAQVSGVVGSEEYKAIASRTEQLSVPVPTATPVSAAPQRDSIFIPEGPPVEQVETPVPMPSALNIDFTKEDKAKLAGLMNVKVSEITPELVSRVNTDDNVRNISGSEAHALYAEILKKSGVSPAAAQEKLKSFDAGFQQEFANGVSVKSNPGRSEPSL